MTYPAESYEKHMVPALFEPWSSTLVERASPQPDERVLDVACGTGIAARRVARAVASTGNVVGLDYSRDMLRVAHAAAKAEGLSIGWMQARAEQLGFVQGCFDLVVCQFGLMLFTGRRVALSEMHRVLRKDGRLVLSVWQGLERHPFYRTLREVSQRRLGTSGVERAFSLGDPDELRRYLADAGFERVEIEPVSSTARFPNPDDFLAWETDVNPAAIPTLRHLDFQAQHAIMDAIRRDMEPELRKVMHEGQVALPFRANIARARR